MSAQSTLACRWNGRGLEGVFVALPQSDVSREPWKGLSLVMPHQLRGTKLCLQNPILLGTNMAKVRLSKELTVL